MLYPYDIFTDFEKLVTELVTHYGVAPGQRAIDQYGLIDYSVIGQRTLEGILAQLTKKEAIAMLDAMKYCANGESYDLLKDLLWCMTTSRKQHDKMMRKEVHRIPEPAATSVINGSWAGILRFRQRLSKLRATTLEKALEYPGYLSDHLPQQVHD